MLETHETGAREAQEQYWQLSYRLAAATLEVQQAEAAMATFRHAHDSETFLVFRPEDIERAVSPVIMPAPTDAMLEVGVVL